MEQINLNMPSKLSNKLVSAVSDFAQAPSVYEFIRLIGRFEMSGKCKPYRNCDGKLPAEGRYIRIGFIGRTSERIVIDMKTFGIFPTTDHYTTFLYAGKPEFMA